MNAGNVISIAFLCIGLVVIFARPKEERNGILLVVGIIFFLGWIASCMRGDGNFDLPGDDPDKQYHHYEYPQ